MHLRVEFSLFCIAILSIGVISCSSKTKGIQDQSALNVILLKEIPIGTSIEKAKAFMEHEGFKCSFQKNSSFIDRKNIDYLYCDRTDGLIVQRRWQVAIVQNEDMTGDILISTGLVGP